MLLSAAVKRTAWTRSFPFARSRTPAQCGLGLRLLTRGLNFRFPPLVFCGEFPATKHVVAKDP